MTEEERNMRVPHVCTLGCQVAPTDHFPAKRFVTKWTTDGEIIFEQPNGIASILVKGNGNDRFARALCHLLNNTPVADLNMTDDEMDQRGVDKNG